jgi:ABC-2 type transport system ATP-binding protein
VVSRGDIFGYLGANGAGKTTTIRILLDLLRPDAGVARILGSSCAEPETRRRVGFVLDADGLYNAMTGIENLVFYAELYGVQLDAAATAGLLDLVGLAGRGNEPVAGFSRGMRQRLALARALAHDPEVLILDEPMSGVDPPGRLDIREILQRLVSEEGKTVLLSSHDLDEVQRLCNRIALIDEGRIRLEGNLRTLMKQSGGNRVQVDLNAEPTREALAAVMANSGLHDVEALGRTLTCVPESGLKIPDVVRVAAAAGLEIAGVHEKVASLEELYRSILREREGIS